MKAVEITQFWHFITSKVLLSVNDFSIASTFFMVLKQKKERFSSHKAHVQLCIRLFDYDLAIFRVKWKIFSGCFRDYYYDEYMMVLSFDLQLCLFNICSFLSLFATVIWEHFVNILRLGQFW